MTTATRSAALPDVPALAEFVPNCEASAWYGFAAASNTPPEVIQKLNTEINAALADPKLNARLADLSATPLAGSPAEFGGLIAEEIEKWGRVIRVADIKPD